MTLLNQETDRLSKKPSNAEIETLCLLYVIGDEGCRKEELPGKLGLSSDLAGVIANAVMPLQTAGWVLTEDEKLSLTESGAKWLSDRLSAWLPGK